MDRLVLLVVSDSHGSNESLERILKEEKHDLAVHLGDHMTSAEFMNEHFDYWVAGNNDFEGEEHVVFEFAGKTFLAMHGHLYFSFTYRHWLEKMAKQGHSLGAQIVLFGHAHFPERFKVGSIEVANPGSTQSPRPSHALNERLRSIPLVPTYMLVTIENGRTSFVFKSLSPL